MENLLLIVKISPLLLLSPPLKTLTSKFNVFFNSKQNLLIIFRAYAFYKTHRLIADFLFIEESSSVAKITFALKWKFKELWFPDYKRITIILNSINMILWGKH